MKKQASFHQERLWFIDKFESGVLYQASPTYHNVPLYIEITGAVNVEILAGCISKLIQKHDSLRTLIITEEDRPIQFINERIEFRLSVTELANEQTSKTEALAICKKFINEPFVIDKDELIRAKLIRIGKDSNLLIVVFHHLIVDEYSLEIFSKELMEYYDLAIQQREPDQTGVPQYSSFSMWQRDLPASINETLLFFWKKQLAGKLQPLKLPIEKNRATVHIYDCQQYDFLINDRITDEARIFITANKIDPQLFFLAAFKLLLSKYSGLAEIVLGIVSVNRKHAGTEKIIGPLSNLLVIRSFIKNDQTVHSFIGELQKSVSNAIKFQDLPFDKLVSDLKIDKDMGRTALFDVLYSYGESENMVIKGSELMFKVSNHNLGWGKYDLNLKIYPSGSCFAGTLTYNGSYYEKSVVTRFVEHYTRLIQEIVSAGPEKRIKDVDYLTTTELLQFTNNSTEEYADTEYFKNIVDLFKEHAMRNPKRRCLIFENRQLSYGEVDELSNVIAEYLRQNTGITNGDRVGILMERSPWVVISILAVLKLGGTYVPVDPRYPKNRTEYIIKDSECKAVLIAGLDKNQFEEANFNCIDVEKIISSDYPACDFKSEVISKDNVCYIIYTSGTTGAPKGCMNTHSNVVSLLTDKAEPYQFSNEDVWILAHSYCFDFSVWEMFGALLHGGALVIPNWNEVRDLKIFQHLLIHNQVTILNQTPGAFYNLIEEEKRYGGNLFKYTRYVFFGGEKLEFKYLREWLTTHDLNSVKLVNMYGITETTVHNTHHTISAEDILFDKGSLIGKPLPKTEVYIMDDDRHLVGTGIPGEIYVGGSGVGKGYYNRKELTDQKFIDHLFKKEAKIYKSGDLGRWLEDGVIEYLGRIDDQVKIRGHRIELGEIESQAVTIEKIEKAIVLPIRKSETEIELSLYYTSKESINSTTIREHLLKALPDYMVPLYYTHLAFFPLTTTGKIDKAALPLPNEANISKMEYRAATNELEATLINIWKEVLKIESVSIHDNFFSIGGDSIRGIRAINKIQEALKQIIHIAVLFECPTVYELAKRLKKYDVKDERGKITQDKIDLIKKKIGLLPSFHLEKKNKSAVFILAPYRSGSTLLRIILSGHDNLFAPPELELLSFNTLQERKQTLSGKFMHEGLARAIKELKGCDSSEAVKIVDEAESANLSTQRMYRLIQEWCKEKILIDKTPTYGFDIEILKRAEEIFDSPKFIHLVRHPQAVINSFVEARIDQVLKFESDFNNAELAEILWQVSHKNTVDFLKDIPASRKHLIRFEDLVSDTPSTISDLCSFLGVHFTPRMLEIYDKSSIRMTDGMFEESRMIGDLKFLTHHKIDSKVAENWRDITNTELSKETILLAHDLGYVIGDQEKFEIPRIDQQPDYELSFAQKRLWVLDRFTSNQMAYNQTHSFVFEGSLNKEILQEAFCYFIQRHEILRTNFIEVDGNPRQIVHPASDFKFHFECKDLRTAGDQMIAQIIHSETNRGFNLEHDPLIRALLIQVRSDKHFLVINTHHIIFDNWSRKILIDELKLYYAMLEKGSSLDNKTLPIQYKDYAAWHNERLKDDTYWDTLYKDEVVQLKLPLDFKRREKFSFKGSTSKIIITKEIATKLKEHAVKHELSLAQILFSIYAILISKWCAQKTFVIGLLVSGRNHPDLEPLIGVFINYLPAKVSVDSNESFSSYFHSFRTTINELLKHQDYPFDELVNKYIKDRETGRNPFFDTLFNFVTAEKTEIAMPTSENNDKLGERTSFASEHQTSTLDFKLDAIEFNEEIQLVMEFRNDLFLISTIENLMLNFEQLINTVVKKPHERIEDVVLFETERKQLRKSKLIVCSTCVMDPLKGALDYWAQDSKLEIEISFAPYNQWMQSLINLGEDSGDEIILLFIRFEDWIRDLNSNSNEEKIQHLTTSYKLFENVIKNVLADDQKKIIFGVLPFNDKGVLATSVGDCISVLYKKFILRFSPRANFLLLELTGIHELYAIESVFDATADIEAHVPYSEEYYAALGTQAIRRIRAFKRKPYKVIIIDCDNTLWKGICGEVGSENIIIEEGHIHFQELLLAKRSEGFLLAVCSKNNEEDVFSAFNHPQMRLKPSDLVTYRINWENKSKNIEEIAEELNLKPESFIFLDDSEFECAEVSQAFPEILALHLPEESREFPIFLGHIWAFDKHNITEDDKLRNQYYNQEKLRQQHKENFYSLEDFIDSLEVQITISAMGEADYDRAAQLFLRTNQFNLNGKIRTRNNIKQYSERADNISWRIDAQDRFGAYGFSGLIMGSVEEDILTIESFLLSCRILGRNIEYKVLEQLETYCKERNLNGMSADYFPTSSNKAFSEFMKKAHWSSCVK